MNVANRGVPMEWSQLDAVFNWGSVSGHYLTRKPVHGGSPLKFTANSVILVNLGLREDMGGLWHAGLSGSAFF